VSRDVHSIKCCNSWCYAKRWLCGDCVEERRIEVVISLSPVLCFAFAQTATLRTQSSESSTDLSTKIPISLHSPMRGFHYGSAII
jgi:hypothetical protein